MFKKLKDEIIGAINISTNRILGVNVSSLNTMQDKINSHTTSVIRQQHHNTIEYYEHIIESLSEALCNKFEKGFLIVSRDGKIPIVINNGKVLTDDNTSEITLKWSNGECPEIEIGGIEYDYEEDSAINVRRNY